MINKDTQLCMSLAGRPGNFGTRFHNYLYQKLGLNFIYKAFTTQDIEHAVKGVRALGIRGCAVSMPFKESCIPFLDELSPSVQAIQSVNTIVNDNGHLTAYNTDYLAIAQLIKEHLNLKNFFKTSCSSVLVLGSGGMAKAVVAAFRDAGFQKLIVGARNRQTGQALADLYGYQYTADWQNQQADILVNVTPIGMQGGAEQFDLAFPEPMIAEAKAIFDVVALPVETPLIQTARALDKIVITGAEVAVLQALAQFELYTGVRPDAELVAEAAAFARANN